MRAYWNSMLLASWIAIACTLMAGCGGQAVSEENAATDQGNPVMDNVPEPTVEEN